MYWSTWDKLRTKARNEDFDLNIPRASAWAKPSRVHSDTFQSGLIKTTAFDYIKDLLAEA